jgi:hypothetical protein
MAFNLRTRRFGVAALGVTIMGGAAAATLSANPAAAAGIITAVTTVSCSVTGANWCISGNNTSSGIGVIGTSKTGTGLRGTSTSQYGLKATSVSNTAILAQTTTGLTAISATAAGTGYGVTGTSGGSGIGTAGVSKNGYGAYGYTTCRERYRAATRIGSAALRVLASATARAIVRTAFPLGLIGSSLAEHIGFGATTILEAVVTARAVFA